MAKVIKEPIDRERIRRISGGFGWVDHRLVRNGYVDACSHLALATYLFLITVSVQPIVGEQVQPMFAQEL